MLSFLPSAVEGIIFNLELMTSIMTFPKEERNKFIYCSSLGVHIVLILGPLFPSSDVRILINFVSEWGENSSPNNFPLIAILGISSVGRWTPTSGTCRSAPVAGLGN